MGGSLQGPQFVLTQSRCRPGRDHHIAALPWVVENKQDAIAKRWQREQSERLQDKKAAAKARLTPREDGRSAVITVTRQQVLLEAEQKRWQRLLL
jgi:hypothetical protein